MDAILRNQMELLIGIFKLWIRISNVHIFICI